MALSIRSDSPDHPVLDVSTVEGDGSVTVAVTFIDHTDVPLVGVLIPDISLTGRATMPIEPGDAGQ